jgi:natural product biosynthesis luciferase-like monooxygenase protein
MTTEQPVDFSIYFFSANDTHDFGDRYRFLLDVARFADQHGFTAIWTPERHFQEFGGSFPNPSVLSAALAVATERIELRAGSVVMPHHHPVRVAEEWALVDQLSGGRVGICLATGWHKGDFVFYPDSYEQRRAVTLASIETLRSLWRGEPMTFPGPDGEMLAARTYPRPVRADLPLWLVHTSNPETWVAAGNHGTNVLTLLDSWERLADNITRYREARAAAGHDPDGGVVTVGLHAYVGDDEAAVWELVREPVRSYLSTFLTQKRNDAAGAGITDEEQETLATLAAEDFYQRRSLLGTPDKCAAIVGRLADLGVGEIACLVDFGLPFPTVLAGLPALDSLRARFAASTPAATTPSAPRTPEPVGATRSTDMSWYYQR